MTKKAKDTEQKAPAPGPAPSVEEMRRRHVEAAGKDRLQQEANNLAELLKGNLKKAETLRALEQVGVKIVEIALQTRGRLRSADGRGDAFLDATAANVRTAFRHADKVMEDHDKEMGAWAEALEIAGPALEDLKRISKGLERPGVKVAIVPGGGDGLFDDEGQPTEKAAAPPAPAPAPKPPAAAPAAQKPEPPATAPGPANVAVREIPVLSMGAGPVIDVEAEPAEDRQEPCDFCGQTAVHDEDCALFGVVGGNGEDEPAAPHFFPDDATPGPCDGHLLEALEELEELGVEAGLKRKDWKKAKEKWADALELIWPAGYEAEDWLARARRCYDLVDFALHHRKPISWDVPDKKDVFEHQRRQALAEPDPAFDLGKEA